FRAYTSLRRTDGGPLRLPVRHPPMPCAHAAPMGTKAKPPGCAQRRRLCCLERHEKNDPLSPTSREMDGSARLFGRSPAPSFSAGRFILIGSFVSEDPRLIMGSRKDKRPNVGPAVWRYQNHNAKLTFRAISSSCSSSLPWRYSLMRPYPSIR